MSENKNNNYLTAEYYTTRRAYNETKKAYIERISKNKIIDFIPRNEIEEKIEYVDVGGSGLITKAKWIKKNITVVLKTVIVSEETNSDNDEFIKEIKAFHNIGLVLSSKTNEENEEKPSLVGYENVIKFYEQPINESTDSYVKLYTNCWDGDPKSRPEINQVYESIRQEDIISGEKWKELPQSCNSSQSNDSPKSSDLSQSSNLSQSSDSLQSSISDADTESNKTNDEELLNIMSEAFGHLSTEIRERILQISD
ncbi:8434_t:CDS:2, partial [Racocetra fulgida]